jgi:hypothetical protein
MAAGGSLQGFERSGKKLTDDAASASISDVGVSPEKGSPEKFTYLRPMKVSGSI